jgi:hypothetical protein
VSGNPGSFRIVRNDNANAAFSDELPGDLARAAFEHLNQLRFFTAATVQADRSDGDAVTMENGTHLARREIHILATVIADQEAEAILMTSNSATNQLQLLQQAKLAAPVLDDLPGSDHLLQLGHQARAHALAFEAKTVHYEAEAVHYRFGF